MRIYAKKLQKKLTSWILTSHHMHMVTSGWGNRNSPAAPQPPEPTPQPPEPTPQWHNQFLNH